MKLRRSRRFLAIAALCAAGAPAPRAQEPRNFEGVETGAYHRSADDVLANLGRLGAPGRTLGPADQFRLDYYSGNWPAVAASLREMPPALAGRVYDKVLADLVAKGEPFLLLDDVLGLARANPGDWTPVRLKNLGLVTKACVPPMQRRWLEQHLQGGVAGLGGAEPAARLRAGRLLIHAQLNEMAARFLPPPEEARAIEDEAARNEVLAFYSIRLDAEPAEEPGPLTALAQPLEQLRNPSTPPVRMKQALGQVVRQIGRLSPPALESTLRSLVEQHPAAAHDLLAEAVRLAREAGRGRSLEARQQNLYRIQSLAEAAAAVAPDGDPRWIVLLQVMADHWVQEADLRYAQRSGAAPAGPPGAVDAADLVATAPDGRWRAALPPALLEKIDLALARCVIAAGDFERAVTLTVEQSRRNPDAALSLADDFLVAWGERHDPNLPEPLRRRFALPETAHITVTPVMMENNIRQLARIMAVFREAGVQWTDNARIVRAFDTLYGSADAYQIRHIEQVFGSVPEMSEGLVLQMMTRMRDSLGGRWRRLEVQQSHLTRRDEDQTLQMVRDGYGAALQIADAWLERHRDGFRVAALAGTLMSDWSDFEYFQQLAAVDGPDRMRAFQEKQTAAQQYFARAVEAYGRLVPALGPGDYSLEAYLAWFHSLLGINSNGDINLSKPLNRAALERLRDAIRSLPGKAAEAHVGLFARHVNGRMQATNPPLHEELKYKYLAGSLLITEDHPFSLPVREQTTYYDELLNEIRLRTSVDGPTDVGRDQDFGVVLSVVHTEAMGRLARFGQYLTNARSPDAARRAQAARAPLLPQVLRMTQIQGPRDALELSLREALEPFFDLRSITFSHPDVGPRPTDQPGWQETVLAYIHLRAKDASVDRIPPVSMDLSFLDLTGPVTLPAQSAETLIRVSPALVPPRPLERVQVVQTLDPRPWPVSGGLTLHVAATGIGLVPELEDLLDLAPLAAVGTVRSAAAHAGTRVRELHSWGDRVTAVSEREWTVVLDAGAARDAGQPVSFRFPNARRAEVELSNRTYDDNNLVPVEGAEVALGGADAALPETPIPAPPPPRFPFLAQVAAAGALAAAALTAIGLLLRRRRAASAARKHAAREAFRLPPQVDGFVVVRLLTKLGCSPAARIRDADRAALAQDIERVQQAVFAPRAEGLSEDELRRIAGRWLARVK